MIEAKKEITHCGENDEFIYYLGIYQINSGK
jgi:hypothetical protein